MPDTSILIIRLYYPGIPGRTVANAQLPRTFDGVFSARQEHGETLNSDSSAMSLFRAYFCVLVGCAGRGGFVSIGSEM